MITHYAANKILDHICARTQDAELNTDRSYLALSSTLPTVEGTNVTEPVGNNYERVLLGYHNEPGSRLMGGAANGNITNEREIHFNEASAAWGTLSYACIFNGDTGGGKLIAWGELGSYVGGVWTPASISPTANSVIVIKTGDLNISIT